MFFRETFALGTIMSICCEWFLSLFSDKDEHTLNVASHCLWLVVVTAYQSNKKSGQYQSTETQRPGRRWSIQGRLSHHNVLCKILLSVGSDDFDRLIII